MRIYQTTILLFFLISCNEDFKGGKRFRDTTQAEETTGAPAPSTFSTRLSNTLLVSGVKCRGTETTESYGNGTLCNAGQYLITLDNVNTCSSGVCTESAVIPIVGELDDIDARLEGESIFEIDPVSSVTGSQKNIIDTIYVRSDANGNGSVRLR